MRGKQWLMLPVALLLVFQFLTETSWAVSQKKGSKHIIKLTNIEFQPNRLLANPGDTLIFINKDNFKHDVYIVRTANPNDVILPATTLENGQSITLPFTEKGVFTVYCTIHGGMRGKISTTGSFELTEDEKRRAAARKVLPPIVKTGKALFWGKAQCYQCHKLGDQGKGQRGPNLQDIGFRARIRAQKLNLSSGTDYLIQSILEPDAYIVEGFSNDMARVYQPPINLNEEEIKAVIAYLQSQGGEVDTWSINLDAGKLKMPPSFDPFTHGDAARGRQLFVKSGCPSCHTVGAQKSKSPGPDLTGIGRYRNWTWLAQSILEPNAEIGAQWKYTTVTVLVDNEGFEVEEDVSGFLRENSDKQIKLLVDNNQVRTFDKQDVVRMELGKSSKMPSNYKDLLTFQQIADLIQYLESLKDEN